MPPAPDAIHEIDANPPLPPDDGPEEFEADEAGWTLPATPAFLITRRQKYERL